MIVETLALAAERRLARSVEHIFAMPMLQPYRLLPEFRELVAVYEAWVRGYDVPASGSPSA